jgi:hypothetical protein
MVIKIKGDDAEPANELTVFYRADASPCLSSVRGAEPDRTRPRRD